MMQFVAPKMEPGVTASRHKFACKISAVRLTITVRLYLEYYNNVSPRSKNYAQTQASHEQLASIYIVFSVQR
jgi:hypothetical protein